MASENTGNSPIPQRKLRRVASATNSMQSSLDSANNSLKTVLDNPTPAMLLVMKRNLEKQLQQSELKKTIYNFDKNCLRGALAALKPLPELLIKRGNLPFLF